jgi:curved DNA-binding protein CbpA
MEIRSPMKLPPSGQVPRLKGDSASDPSLDAMAKLVLSWVDGKASIAEIGEMCGMGDDMARRIVGDLARRGVLEVQGFEVGAAPQQAAPGSASPPPDGLVAEVEQVYLRVESANFYDLLGVEPDADRKKLRSAYFALSKKFHPDRAFGKDAGDMRRKMEIIFRRMTQAYDVLSNKAQRAEYDAYIADQLEVWRIEKQLKDAIELEKGLDSKSSEPPPAAPEPPSQPPAQAARGSRPITGRSPQRARTTARPVAATQSRPSIPARDPKHDARRRQWRRERAGRALKKSLKQTNRAMGGPVIKIADKLDQAAIALEQEQFSEATRLLEEVLKADARNEKARKLLAQANSGAVKALAKGYIRQGMYERRQHDVLRARTNFEKALEVDATSVDARYQLADLLLEQRMELPRALTLCKEVIGMGGQRARYFATLGELLLLAKQPVRASEAFRKALEIEPGSREYKKRLKACKS